MHIGAIRWQNLLFEHLKKSVIAFKKVENDPGLANSYFKRTAFSQYFELINNMNEYEKEHVQEYLKNATLIVNNILKRNILRLKIHDAKKELVSVRKIKKPETVAPVSFRNLFLALEKYLKKLQFIRNEKQQLEHQKQIEDQFVSFNVRIRINLKQRQKQ